MMRWFLFKAQFLGFRDIEEIMERLSNEIGGLGSGVKISWVEWYGNYKESHSTQ